MVLVIIGLEAIMYNLHLIGNDDLYNTVESLRVLHREGDYWDFKKEWHDDKSDLLHDIICMANNLSGNDGLIIIGVDESNDHKYVDVTHNKNRYNTQQIVDFLSSKKFAGDCRPTVYVETIQAEKISIDVIVVISDNKVPYYLSERYQQVVANHIYVRVGDTNTPINKSADNTVIEKLWKRRFGIDLPAIERFKIYLKNPADWIELIDGNGYYYKYSPEFSISYTIDERRTGREYYMLSQYDNRPSWYNGCLYYHQTAMEGIIFNSLDGGRLFVTVPDWRLINLKDRSSIFYRSYVVGSIKWLINRITKYDDSDYDFSWRRLVKCILIFNDEKERTEFEKYVSSNFDLSLLINYSDQVPVMHGITSERERQVFAEEYCNALLLKDMLSDFKRKII